MSLARYQPLLIQMTPIERQTMRQPLAIQTSNDLPIRGRSISSSLSPSTVRNEHAVQPSTSHSPAVSKNHTSPLSITSNLTTRPAYESQYFVPLEYQAQQAESATRSKSLPVLRGTHEQSSNGKQAKGGRSRQDGHVSWSRRLMDAVKDLFKKEPVDDSQYERIEDRHWTDL